MHQPVERIDGGFSVKDVRGRNIGTVARILIDCFEVSTPDRRSMHLTQPAIFDVQHGEVSLVCDREEVQRYACPNHR